MKQFWLIDQILFQAAWWCCVLMQDHAAFILLGLIGIHALLSPTKQQDLKISLIALLGITFDQLMISLGFINTGTAFIPLWLILLWLCFIRTFNHSLQWMIRLPYSALMIIGFIVGPLSYGSAAYLDAIDMATPNLNSIFFYGIGFSLLLPAIKAYSQRVIENDLKLGDKS